MKHKTQINIQIKDQPDYNWLLLIFNKPLRMTIYYWAGATGTEDLLTEHSDAIRCLVTGEYDKNDLEKLRANSSHPIYSFRLNQRARLLFTTHHGCLHVLEFLPSHDYQKSRFLKTGVLNRYLERNAGEKMPVHFSELTAEEPTLVFDDSDKKNRLVSLNYYNQQFIQLSEEQAGIVQKARLPIILNGQAGAGKTLLATWLMARACEGSRVLYVTKEAYLAKKIESNYAGMSQDDAHVAEFKTYDELIAAYCGGKELITRDFFNAWFMDLKATDTLSAKQYYQEFRICSGFSKADYLRLGERQSTIPPEQRERMHDMYQRYLRHLDAHEKIDPAFSTIEIDAGYDMIVVDEAQNFSLQQLLLLERLATHHAIVYCMDPNQNMMDATPMRVLLKQLLREVNITSINLEKTYRYTERVGQALNNMLELKHRIIGGKIDKDEASAMSLAGGMPAGEFFLITPDKLNKHTWIDARLGHLAVVTTAALLDEAKRVFRTPLVFTPAQIQGQEFHTVVIYQLLSDAAKMKVMEKHASMHRAKPGELDYTHAPYLGEYYTACSRAINTLVIIEERNRSTAMFLASLETSESSHAPAAITLPPVDWQAIAEEQRARGNIQIAEAIHMVCLTPPSALQNASHAKPAISSPTTKQSPKKPAALVPRPAPIAAPVLPRIDPKLGVQFITAAEKGKSKEVTKLLNNPQLDANHIIEGKINALVMAAQNGHDKVVSLLLKSEERVNPNLFLPADGRTPLGMAARNNHRHVVKILLDDSRIDVNQATSTGATALLIAAQYGFLSIVRLLLASPDIKPNLATSNGGTALLMAIQYQRLDVFIALLSDTRVDVNYQDINGITPLMMAVHMNAEFVRLLLLHPKLNVHQTCQYAITCQAHNLNCTALFRAVYGFSNSILSILLDDPRILLDDVLPKMIHEPAYVMDACQQNPVFLAALIKKRDVLWSQIKSPESLGLTREAHLALLRTIRDSEKKDDATPRHILYDVLCQQQRHQPRLFSHSGTVREELHQLLALEDNRDETKATLL